jgi:hypothetical protein
VLLVHLLDRMTYKEHHTARELDMLVAVPAIRGHRAPRLLLTWTAVRFVAVSSFALESYARTIGTGRLALHKHGAGHVDGQDT